MKTGFWLKGGKGKLAGATVYSQNGETVMREVVTPTNPKTEKQIIQRIIMHTVMGAYSKMKEICDHSFEGFKQGQETMSYFLSQNVGFAREKVAGMQQSGVDFSVMFNFVPLKMKGFTPNQYQVSMGSLPRVDCNIRPEDPNSAYVPVVKTNTYAAVAQALGAQRGDQVTFLLIDGNDLVHSFGQCNFKFARVILDPTNADFSQASMDVPFLTGEGKINLPSVRNEGNFSFNIDATNGLSFTNDASNYIWAGAVILSRQMNDKWLRSTAYLTYDGVEQYSLGECISMAQNGTNSQIYAAADAYLNNAGQGGGAAAEASNSENGSSSGGNSNVTPTPAEAALASVTINGNAAIAGTQKVISVDSDSPSVTIVATGNDACNGNFLSIQTAAGAEIASGVFNSGSVSVTHTLQAGTNYKLVIVDENSDVVAQTAYTFYLDNNDNGDMGG